MSIMCEEREANTKNKNNAEDISTHLVDLNDRLESDSLPISPYSGMLKKDDNIQYSHEKLIETIKFWFKKKSPNKTNIEKLKAVIDFPTPYIFAKLSSKAYNDYNSQKRDIYEQDLPKGWRLLTTASNAELINDYFGVAFFNVNKQQIIVAHRGTNSLKAYMTDLNSIILNFCDPQMKSACTFADKIIDLLNKLNKEQLKFHLFFTGHSLGGWLAQVTTFTSKYLTIEGNIFLKAKHEGYHAHTVVFDSPGCKSMLIRMQENFALRYHSINILSIDTLDITSYLSAPNPINTYNSHVGTIYRIFVDLPNELPWEPWKLWKPWKEYIFETHSMDKILKSFDQFTGQVHKDKEGKLKIKTVLDWPIGFRLQKEWEFINFFKWADHFNNYDPDVKSETFQTELAIKHGTSPIRYQVENVNWNICSTNIFTQEEFLFLKNYQLLRALKDSFIPKNLFCDINDLETEYKVIEVLENFEIKKNKIIFPNEKELHTFIHYVKNLLHFFPKIKDKVKKALTEDGKKEAIIKLQSLNNYNIASKHFHNFTDTSGVKTLINGNTKVLLLFVNEDTHIWLARIYETYNKTFDKEEDVLLNLKEVLHLKKEFYSKQTMKDFVDDLMRKKLLILFECKLNVNENKEIIGNLFLCLFEKIKNKNIKVIFVARISSLQGNKLEDLVESATISSHISYEKKYVDPLTWFNFSDKFKEELFKRPLIVFQGQKEGTSLNKLMGNKACEQFIVLNNDHEFLMQLINNENIIIDSKLPVTSGYDESSYIERNFIYQVEIKAEIFEKENSKDDLRVNSGKESEKETLSIPKQGEIYIYEESNADKKNPIKFIILDSAVAENFQQYPKKINIHMLKFISDRLIWMKSQGAISNLSKYVKKDEDHTKNYTESQMLANSSKHKVLIISDVAGMGKSTVLTRMSHIMRRTSPNFWLFRIDLNDYTKKLKEIKDKNTFKFIEVIEFLSNNLFEATTLKQTLFRYYCQDDINLKKLIIMFDGFDEISPDYKEIVLHIVKVLRENDVKQIWITTRPNMQQYLEDNLQQFAFKLKPLSQVDQILFLTNFWNLKLNFYNENQDRLQLFARTLIEKFANLICDTAYTFIGIPLQTIMLAEVFLSPCEQFLKSNELEPQLPEQFKIFDLYESFFYTKLKIYYEQKNKVDLSKPGNILDQELIESYQIMALHTILNEQISNNLISQHLLQQFTLKQPQVAALISDETQLKNVYSSEAKQKIKSFIESIKSGKRNHGIVSRVYDGSFHFVHRTFAEYLVSIFLVNSLKNLMMQQLISVLLIKHILVEEGYQVIRIFLNDQFELSSELWDSDNKNCYIKCPEIINIARRENNINIIKLIFNHLRKFTKINPEFTEIYTEICNDFLNQVALFDNEGRNQYYMELYDLAIHSFLESHKLKLLIPHLHPQEIADSAINIGTTYAKQGQYESAIKYLKMSKTNVDQDKPHLNVAVCLNNLGSIYWNKEQYKKAVKSYRQALIVISKLNVELDKRFNLGDDKRLNQLKVMTNNLIKLFAKRYSLNRDDIRNFITTSEVLSNNCSNEKHKEKIKKYKLSLLFLPENKSEAKFEISTILADLEKTDKKNVDLWLALAEGNSNKVAELLANGANSNASFIKTYPVVKGYVKVGENGADSPMFDNKTPMNIAYDTVSRKALDLFEQIGRPNMTIRNAKRKRPLDNLLEKPGISSSTKLNIYKDFYQNFDLEIEDGKPSHYVIPQQQNNALETHDINPKTKKRRYDLITKDQQCKTDWTKSNYSIENMDNLDGTFGDNDHFPYLFLSYHNC